MRVRLSIVVLVSTLVWVVVAAAGEEKSAQEVTDAVNKWFREVGSPADVVEIAEMSYGRGIRARGAIKKGDLVTHMPLDYVFCKKTALASSQYRAVFNELSDEVDILAIFLMLENSDQKSRWRPWLDSLPQKLTSPLFFADGDYEFMKGDPSLTETRNYVNGVKNAYKDTVTRILKQFPKVFTKKRAAHWTEERYIWARAMFDSRAWFFEGTRYLVPIADMFNFAPSHDQMNGVPRTGIRGEAFKKSHRVSASAVDCYAEDNFKIGEEVFESYGDNSNPIYFKYHGFVPAMNPDNCMMIRLALSKSDPDYDEKIELLKTIGVGRPPSQTCFTDPSLKMYNKRPYPIEDNMLLYLTVQSLNPAQFKALKGHKDRSDFKERVLSRLAHSPAALQTLADAAAATLSSYPTTIEADEKRLKDKKLTPTQRIIVEFVLSRKRILKNLHDKINFPAYTGAANFAAALKTFTSQEEL